MTTEPLSFPRRHARTQRFTLGAPRAFAVAPDGSRVVFLRSRSGTDRANLLWVLDVADGAERVAADPQALLGGASEHLSAAERARRERSREGGAGVVGYATDTAVELASFALSGRLFTAELRAGTARELRVPGPVIDPRPSPDGRLVAYVAGGALRVVGAEGADDRALAEPEAETVSYGLAEFIAAEEMGRSRGFWWSPEGTGCWSRGPTTRPYAAGGSRIPHNRNVIRSGSLIRWREAPTRTYASSSSVSTGCARRSCGTGRGTRTWRMCTGQRPVHH